jgi:hypothetical protein
MTYAETNQYRQGMIEFCERLHSGYAICLRTNLDYSVDLTVGQKRLNHFCNLLDHEFLGKRWMKALDAGVVGTRMIAIPEGRPGRGEDSMIDPHYHGLFTLPPTSRTAALLDLDGMRELASRFWGNCVAKGDTHVDLITSAGAAAYATKHLYGRNCEAMSHFCFR